MPRVYQHPSSKARTEAIERNEKTYLGLPCSRCDQPEKFVTSSGCVKCTTERTVNRSPAVTERYQQSEKGKKRKKQYRKSKPDTMKAIMLRSVYGITLEEYNIKLEEQNSVCATCGKLPKRGLCVDHNHTTKKVRGLLCHHCNTALGMADENVETLLKMVEYLQRYGEKNDHNVSGE